MLQMPIPSIYSVTKTAKANNLNPFQYLKHVLTVLKGHQNDREWSFIDDILTESENLPEICWCKAKATLLKNKFCILEKTVWMF